MIELSKIAGLEPSTMTGLLDRMERDELVARKKDPTDRRDAEDSFNKNWPADPRSGVKRGGPGDNESLCRHLAG